MDIEDFERHLQNGESTTVELKRCGNKPGQDAFETICSFGNRLGGSIFLGVEDDGTVASTGDPNADKMECNVVNVANNPRLFYPLPSPEFEGIDYHGKKVALIQDCRQRARKQCGHHYQIFSACAQRHETRFSSRG